MGTVKRAGDSDSSERQQRLNDSKTDYKKAKMGSSNSWNDRDRLYTTREPGTHEALDSTSLGEREKHRSDASVHLHIDLFSNFDQNGTLVEQGDKERKAVLSTIENENDENDFTATTEAHVSSNEASETSSDEKSDTTTDARTDASKEDLKATAEALLAIKESHPAPSESLVRGAETLLLLAARDVRVAPEEVGDIAGSCSASSRGRTGTGEALAGNEQPAAREVVHAAPGALARVYLTALEGVEDVSTSDGKADALETWKPKPARISALIADASGPPQAPTRGASKAYSPSPLSASTSAPTAPAPTSAPAPAPAPSATPSETQTQTARLAHINTLMIPRCPLQRQLLEIQHAWALAEMIFLFGNRWRRRPDAQRAMAEWVRGRRESEGVEEREWEEVCEFADEEEGEGEGMRGRCEVVAGGRMEEV